MGLPTPRQSLRIVKGIDESHHRLIITKTNKDITEDMISTVCQLLNDISHHPLHGAILKSRSPSCGYKDVKLYSKNENGSTIKSNIHGFYTTSLLERYSTLPIEHEGRLSNYNIRYQFFTQIFALAEFDRISNMRNLIDFHSDYKYLLMSYSPGYLKKMGPIVANRHKDPFQKILQNYKTLLYKALCVQPKIGRNINMLLHLFGYFSKDLTADEKAYFLDILEDYHEKRIPYSVPLNLIHAWVIRFDEPYLKRQRIFEPFPNALVHVTDSGKGL